MTLILEDLHWLSTCFWGEFEVLVTHKALKDLGSKELEGHLSLYLSAHEPRSGEEAPLDVLPLRHVYHAVRHKNVFCAVTLHLWNVILLETYLALTLLLPEKDSYVSLGICSSPVVSVILKFLLHSKLYLFFVCLL